MTKRPVRSTAFILGMLTVLAGCGVSGDSEVSSAGGSPVDASPSGPSASAAPDQACAALWEDTRRSERAQGRRDGEARRAADRARADCEGIPLEVPPPTAQCLTDAQRRDAPAPELPPSSVAVYFSCGPEVPSGPKPHVYQFERPVDYGASMTERVQTALDAYLAGPSAGEAAQGYVGALTDLAIGDVTVTESHGSLQLDFATKIEAIPAIGVTSYSTALLAELTALVGQFESVDSVSLTVEGACARFWALFERSTCETLETGAQR